MMSNHITELVIASGFIFAYILVFTGIVYLFLRLIQLFPAPADESSQSIETEG